MRVLKTVSPLLLVSLFLIVLVGSSLFFVKHQRPDVAPSTAFEARSAAALKTNPDSRSPSAAPLVPGSSSPSAAPLVPGSSGQMYTSEQYAFSFRISDELVLKDDTGEGSVISLTDRKTRTQDLTIETVARLPDDSCADAESFTCLSEQALGYCQADGANGGVSCPSVNRSENITTKAGLRGFILYLNQISVDRTDPTHPIIKSQSVRGPMAILDVYVPTHHQAVAIYLYPDLSTPGTIDEAMLRAIADSLSFRN